MYYILNEELMSGTVTVDIWNTIVEADSFTEAIEKLKASFKSPIDNIRETEDSFGFSVPQPDNGSYLEVWGRMANKPMSIIK